MFLEIGMAMAMAGVVLMDPTPVQAPDGAPDIEQVEREPEDQTPTGKFTTATEIKPILGATKASWVGVRDWDGNDLVYFTHLLAWRCGLWQIEYGMNGAEPDTPLEMEPCYSDTAVPNALKVEDVLPYIVEPAASVQSISIRLTYDDGTQETASFERNSVLIP